MKLAMFILAWLLLIWTVVVMIAQLWQAITCKSTEKSEQHLTQVFARMPALVFFVYYLF